MLILYRTIDIKDSINPVVRAPILRRVIGIEKYLVSLKSETTFTEYIIPIIVRIKPGIPSKSNGLFNEII